jgi:undecaprenyl-diphosphatase
MESMSYPQAFGIGFCQILAAIFPGTSRSAATILGGLAAGLTREAAAEFSFFLAIPAMTAASAYKLLQLMKTGAGITPHQWGVLTVGTVVSFLVAWAVIGWFMHYIRRHTFVPFAVYRIVLAVIVLALAG